MPIFLSTMLLIPKKTCGILCLEGPAWEHSALAGSIGRKHEQAQKEHVGKQRQVNLERARSGEHDQNLLENSKLSKN